MWFNANRSASRAGVARPVRARVPHLEESSLQAKTTIGVPGAKTHLSTTPAASSQGVAPTLAVAPVSDAPSMGRALSGPEDPRWVLALRTSEQLEGIVLTTEKRARLIQLGERLGLSAFDANLVIAIVQDQARRGFAPQWCPAAGEQQLTLVPLHPHRMDDAWGRWLAARLRGRRALYIAWALAGIIAVELLVLWAVVH